MLSGCSISTTVKPVETQISNLCIKRNPAVFMDGFLPELKTQVEQQNISTIIVDDFNKSECTNKLEYTANWAWDLAIYLTYAELNVYENTTLVGQAIYDARWGGGRLDKFGPTANKLKTLIDPLFYKNHLKKHEAEQKYSPTGSAVSSSLPPMPINKPVVNKTEYYKVPVTNLSPVTNIVSKEPVSNYDNNTNISSTRSKGDLRDCLKLQTNEEIIRCTEIAR